MPAEQQWAASLWSLGVAALLIIGMYLMVRAGWFRKATGGTVPDQDIYPEPTPPVHDYPEDLAEGHGPVPLILKLGAVAFVMWTIGYVVLFWRAMQGPYGEVARFLSGG